ncbi:hypothetical protein SUGI_1006310 [Cryptomeria japonica]|nr:hypothetical protein SUGI_1006310 [Cryptomeria japonica]
MARKNNNNHHNSNFPDNNNQEDYPHLDDDAVEEILRRLPLPSLVRAKSVSKAWNTAILAPNFSLINVIKETHHFLIQHMVDGYQGIAFFSSELNRWFRIPLPWNRWSWHYTKPYQQSYPNQLYLCGAAAGLYLFLDWDRLLSRTPVIFNPVTKERRDVPPLPDYYRWAIGTPGQSGHDHVEDIPTDLRSLVYNSTTDKWRDVPATPVVYFTQNNGRHLGCYDIAGGVFQFKEIEGGLPSQMDLHDHDKNQNASLPSLVASSGKLFWVGRLQKKAGEGSILGRLPLIKHKLVGIWELHKNKQWSWSLISVTPQDLLEETVKSSHRTDFMVAGASNKIWLTINGSVHVMRLDLRSMEWSVLPGCPAEDLFDCSPRRAVSGTLSL